MSGKFPSFIILLALINILIGCSGADPVNPVAQPEESTDKRTVVTSANHQSWGLWEIHCNPVSGSVDVIPLRSAFFNANVVKFLQPPENPGNMLTTTVKPGSDPENGFWIIDVTIRHPFYSNRKFRGFDVRGIIMAEGGAIGLHDSSISYHLPEGTRLLNPDGYTRWWNMREFTTSGTIFGYTEGIKAVPGTFASATLNPYKLFSDDLDADEQLISMDPDRRATFGISPGMNSRRYEIQFEIDGGVPSTRFKYAIDASWSPPDAQLGPEFPVEAFDLSANCREAYMLAGIQFEEIPYYESPDKLGGDAIFLLSIGDWQAVDQGDGESVLNQTDHIWVESPTLLGSAIDVKPSAVFVESGHHTQATFRVSVPGCTPTGLVEQRFLISVESSAPVSYKPQISGDPYMFEWPDAALAAYMVVDVPISSEGPPEPQSRLVVGVSDWGTFEGECFETTDCYQFCINLFQWDIEGPANDNTTIKWWEGHLYPYPGEDTTELAGLVSSLGYTFVRSTEPEFDALGCRLVLVNFCGYPGGYCYPFSDTEASDMRDFVADGGILVFLIEDEIWMQVGEFNTLMERIQVPLAYGGCVFPSSDFPPGDLITPHILTDGVSGFCYFTSGIYDLLSDECISLVRSTQGEDIVVVAPMAFE